VGEGAHCCRMKKLKLAVSKTNTATMIATS
jgi:hypothetical protein